MILEILFRWNLLDTSSICHKFITKLRNMLHILSSFSSDHLVLFVFVFFILIILVGNNKFVIMLLSNLYKF
jgi:hypothetical protein